MTRAEANARISAILTRYVAGPDPRAFDLLPKALTAGKLYEAYAVALIASKLDSTEGLELTLVNSSYLPLKSSPGPINRTYPHISIERAGSLVAEMWTDIEFLSLSYLIRGTSVPGLGDYHELDIAVVEPGLSGRPRGDQVWLGAECKNTGYTKGLLKEILGVRRELSLLTDKKQTRFIAWPRTNVPCEPPSCLLVYASDATVLNYSRPGEVFGIDFHFEELNI